MSSFTSTHCTVTPTSHSVSHKLKVALKKKWDTTSTLFKTSHPKDVFECFSKIDKNNNNKITFLEFVGEMCELASLSSDECEILFDIFNKGVDRVLTYPEFLIGIHNVLKPNRQSIITNVFYRINKNQSKTITIEDLVYFPIEVDKTNFINTVLGSYNINTSNQITLDEFLNFYTDKSAYMMDDEEFIEFLCGAWKLSSVGYILPKKKTIPHKPYACNGCDSCRGFTSELAFSKKQCVHVPVPVPVHVPVPVPVPVPVQSNPSCIDKIHKDEIKPNTKNSVQVRKHLDVIRDRIITELHSKKPWKVITYYDIACKLYSRIEKSKDNMLSQLEFCEFFSKTPYNFSKNECKHIFAEIDVSCGGWVSPLEFIQATYGRISEERFREIKSLFDRLKDHAENSIVLYSFKTSSHPDVLCGKAIDSLCFIKFAESAPAIYNMTRDVKSISFYTFLNIHINLSLSIPDDAEFKRTILKVWRL